MSNLGQCLTGRLEGDRLLGPDSLSWVKYQEGTGMCCVLVERPLPHQGLQRAASSFHLQWVTTSVDAGDGRTEMNLKHNRDTLRFVPGISSF